MRHFRTFESFFNPPPKAKPVKKQKQPPKITNQVDVEQKGQQAVQILDEIAQRAALAHSTGSPAGNPSFNRK